jgi:long-chain fatty acid transport protein
VAFRPASGHSVGAALTFAYQRFAATGLSAFEGMTANPGSVTDRGHDSSTGWGVKLGWLGQVLPDLRLGRAGRPASR